MTTLKERLDILRLVRWQGMGGCDLSSWWCVLDGIAHALTPGLSGLKPLCDIHAVIATEAEMKNIEAAQVAGRHLVERARRTFEMTEQGQVDPLDPEIDPVMLAVIHWAQEHGTGGLSTTKEAAFNMDALFVEERHIHWHIEHGVAVGDGALCSTCGTVKLEQVAAGRWMVSPS